MDGEANPREQRACRRLPNDSGEVGEARHAGAALPIARQSIVDAGGLVR